MRNPYNPITIFNKTLPIFVRGTGKIPLLVLGPATLFSKPGFIPTEFDNLFQIYFVDIFSGQQKDFDYQTLQLQDFVLAIDTVQKHLALEKIALFAHSAMGVLAVEYTRQFSSQVICSLLICSAPFWDDRKNKFTNCFFAKNSTKERQSLYAAAQEEEKTAVHHSFVSRYKARGAQFYFDPKYALWDHLWDEVNLDESLTQRYFALIQGYDVTKNPPPPIPIFIGVGLYDYSSPFEAWTDYAKDFMAKMHYYIFEESGHYPFIEEPRLFYKAVSSFLEANPGSDASAPCEISK